MRRLAGLIVLVLGLVALKGGFEPLRTSIHLVERAIARAPVTLLVVGLIGWLLGFLVGRYRRSVRAGTFQNRGEALLSLELKRRFLAPDYHLMNHLTLRLADGTTQIDHVLISRFGVFVIETKDYKGWIFANPSERYWTQVLYRVKFRFQNPLRQNFKHVCAIRELLDFLPADAVRSAVVFMGKSEFKTDVPDGVYRVNGFMDLVAEQTREVMSLNRVQFCVGRLETARLAVTRATDIEHVEMLRRRYGSSD